MHTHIHAHRKCICIPCDFVRKIHVQIVPRSVWVDTGEVMSQVYSNRPQQDGVMREGGRDGALSANCLSVGSP